VSANAALSGEVAAFTAFLRTEYGFGAGQGETQEALRAAELIGIADERRLRHAWRLVYSTTREEAERFDDAFAAFFRAPRGVRQPPPRARRPRAQPEASANDDARRPAEGNDDAATRWTELRARFSPGIGHSAMPQLEADGLDRLLALADRLIARTRIAQARRWRAHPRGTRVDLRRTVRASLATGGEPLVLRRAAHPLRHARFVLLIDGSRSMAPHAAPILHFAHALARRTRRAHAFVFSTALRDITAELRNPQLPRTGLPLLGEAWGGGTRIGANLAAFVRGAHARLVRADTIVLIYSDGLDVGDLDLLEGALRTLRGRAAAVVWLNPHAGTAGFAPQAGGMRRALPYLDALLPAANDADLAALPDALAKLLR
jgi:uncharacterized protein with von Willebrand factor type A (vWA) domain